jgi:hypothetical protein
MKLLRKQEPFIYGSYDMPSPDQWNQEMQVFLRLTSKDTNSQVAFLLKTLTNLMERKEFLDVLAENKPGFFYFNKKKNLADIKNPKVLSLYQTIITTSLTNLPAPLRENAKPEEKGLDDKPWINHWKLIENGIPLLFSTIYHIRKPKEGDKDEEKWKEGDEWRIGKDYEESEYESIVIDTSTDIVEVFRELPYFMYQNVPPYTIQIQKQNTQIIEAIISWKFSIPTFFYDKNDKTNPNKNDFIPNPNYNPFYNKSLREELEEKGLNKDEIEERIAEKGSRQFLPATSVSASARSHFDQLIVNRYAKLQDSSYLISPEKAFIPNMYSEAKGLYYDEENGPEINVEFIPHYDDAHETPEERNEFKIIDAPAQYTPNWRDHLDFFQEIAIFKFLPVYHLIREYITLNIKVHDQDYKLYRPRFAELYQHFRRGFNDWISLVSLSPTTQGDAEKLRVFLERSVEKNDSKNCFSALAESIDEFYRNAMKMNKPNLVSSQHHKLKKYLEFVDTLPSTKPRNEDQLREFALDLNDKTIYCFGKPIKFVKFDTKDEQATIDAIETLIKILEENGWFYTIPNDVYRLKVEIEAGNIENPIMTKKRKEIEYKLYQVYLYMSGAIKVITY